MAERPPPSPHRRSPLALVDLHTSVATAAAAAAALMNENSSASTAGGGGVDLQCPATPHHKMPELFTSSSDSEPEEQSASQQLEASAGNGGASSSNAAEAGRAAAVSPPPNCAICLGRCKNKCFTDSCMHQFCFKCLCEWSKVKPECPLCKQTFKSIIHNVKSIDQFEEYHVQPPTVQIPHRPIEVTTYGPYFVDGIVVNDRNDYEISVANWDGPRAAHRIVRAGRTILYPSNFTGVAAGSGASGSGASVGVVHRGELLDMYRQEFPDAVASSGTLSQLWRRYVYDRKLYALPVCDITGRFRDSSARFYRDNPAQIHRLMPWINRDIVCLLRNTEHDVTSVLESINEGLTLLNILSPGFRRRLQRFLGTKTSHFVHELNNFARSPYDMIGYDRTVQYSPQTAEEVVIEFSSSDSSGEEEEENEVVEGNANAVEGGGLVAERRMRRRQAAAAAATAAGAAGATTALSTRQHQQQLPAARNLSQYRVQSRAAAAAATAAAASNSSSTSAQQPPPPMVNLLSFTISTTSEGVEAPGVTVAVTGGRGAQSTAINLTTHNRATAAAAAAAGASDLIIDLDDNDADTDVEAEATSTSGDNLNVSNVSNVSNISNLLRSNAPSPHSPRVTENIELMSSSSDECEFVLERKAPHLRTPEMVSLNSDSDSDVVFVDESKTKNNTPSGANVVAPTSATGWETEDEHDDVALKRIEAAKMLEIYNLGASTSAGLRSTGRKRRQKSLDAEKLNTRRDVRRPRMCSGNDVEGQQPQLRLRSRGKRIGSESSFDSEEEAAATHCRPTFSTTDDSDNDDKLNTKDDDDDEDYVRNQRSRVKAGGSTDVKRTTRTARRRAVRSRATSTNASKKRRLSKTNGRPHLLKRSKLSAAATTAATAAATDETDSDEELDERLSLIALKKRLAAQRERAAAERVDIKPQPDQPKAEPHSGSDDGSMHSEALGRTRPDAKNYGPPPASPDKSDSDASSDRHNSSSDSSASTSRNSLHAAGPSNADQLAVASARARAHFAGRGTPCSSTSSSSLTRSASASASASHSHSNSHSNSNSMASSPRSRVASTSAGEESQSAGGSGSGENSNSNSNLNIFNSRFTRDHDAAEALWPPPEEEEEEEEEEPEAEEFGSTTAAADCSFTSVASSSSSSSSLAATNEAAAALAAMAAFGSSDTRHRSLSASFSGGGGVGAHAASPIYSTPEASDHSSGEL